MIHFYKEKYPNGSEFLVIKSLNYFEDADRDETPFMLEPFDWENVKETIKQHVKAYIS